MMKTRSLVALLFTLFLLGSHMVLGEATIASRAEIIRELRILEAIKLWKPKYLVERRRSRNPFLKQSSAALRRKRHPKLAKLQRRELVAMLKTQGGGSALANLTELVSEEFRHLHQLGASVCLVTDSRLLSVTDDGYHFPENSPFPHMASGQPFAQEKSLGFTSGFVVGSDLVVTSGIPPGTDPEDLSLVFDYHHGQQGKAVSLDLGQVYRVKQFLNEPESLSDVVFLKLDRPLAERPPLELAGETPEKRDPLFTLGYSHGLPLKATKGKFKKAEEDGFARVILRSLSGGVGSPVFDEETRQVVGIIVEDAESAVPIVVDDELRLYVDEPGSKAQRVILSEHLRRGLRK